jgi:hypothetical protein
MCQEESLMKILLVLVTDVRGRVLENRLLFQLLTMYKQGLYYNIVKPNHRYKQGLHTFKY